MKRLLAACGFSLFVAVSGVAVAAAPAINRAETPTSTSPAHEAPTHVENAGTGAPQGRAAGEAHGTEAPGHATGGAHAEGHGGEEGSHDPVSANLNLGEFIVTIVIFLALLVVLRAVAWKPILTGLKNREAAIRDSIEAAQKAKAEADRTTRELESRMAEAQRQAAQQINQAKADAQRAADTIRAQAEAESAALKDRTLREIDAAKQQALTEINSHAAELGTAVARKILQRNVTVDDQARLVEESLSELAKKN
jgi:F-type H+-transporting ATPase subunit b